MFKLFIAIAFLAILASLGSALYHLARHRDHSEETAKALTLRIALSMALFILLFLAFAGGFIKPHGIAANMQAQTATKTAPAVSTAGEQ
jgi:small neutral amino acid transporter SnatA (MarC family)